ncbi:MAG: hypothetical protein HQL46_00275 [Gammaproteobacteria bacterium]|nr:hypothetical protein [Gammaproteobacteria bacterium]
MLDFIARFQFFFYPLLVHLSVSYHVPFLVACLLPFFYFIIARPDLADGQQKKTKLLIFIALLSIAVFSWYYLDHSIIYLPPILMISIIWYPFVRSVLPNRTPLITRFYQLTKQENEPAEMRYTDILTWVWVVFIALLLVNTLFLTFWASLEVWSLFTNFVNYLLLLTLLFAEWVFRLFWFKRWESPIEFTRQLMTIDQRKLLQ